MNTSTSKRWQSLAISAVAAAAAAVLLASPVSADVVGTNQFASTSNGSDPFLFRCGSQYCLVTSKDTGESGIDPTPYYPMKDTLGYTSVDGLRWTAATTVKNESDLLGLPAGQGPRHLWAPSVRYTTSRGIDTYSLYIPDFTPDRNNQYTQYSSRIYVTTADSPMGPYTRRGTLLTQNGNPPLGENNTGYMSDPEVFSDSATPDSNTYNDYLVWANGDGFNCGGISIAKMTSSTSVESTPANSPEWSQIQINGLSALGTCTTTNRSVEKVVATNGTVTYQIRPAGYVYQRPYLEGASLYNLSRWKVTTQNHNNYGNEPYKLVFAAKPSTTPAACTQNGEPNTNLSVIAYASAPSVTGPWTYRGILMCGSSTEWTNQASLQEVPDGAGGYVLVLAYHDAPVKDGTKSNRKLHSECIYTTGDLENSPNLFQRAQRTKDGAVNASGARAWCTNQGSKDIIGIKAGNQWVTAASDSNGYFFLKTTGVPAFTSDMQFSIQVVNGVTSFNARSSGKWVQSNQGRAPIGHLAARGAAVGDWEKMYFVPVGGRAVDQYYIRDNYNKYVVVDANGLLIANGTSTTATRFNVLRMHKQH